LITISKMSKDQSTEKSRNALSNLMNNAFENVENPLVDQSTAPTQSKSKISNVGCEQILKKYNNMSGKNRIYIYIYI